MRQFLFLLAAFTLLSTTSARAADVFVRFRVIEPPGEKFRVAMGGFIHVENWYLPVEDGRRGRRPVEPVDRPAASGRSTSGSTARAAWPNGRR